MNDSVFGIVVTILILGVVLAVSVGSQGGIDLPSYNPNGAQTKSIEQIKTDNISENQDALKKYCEALNINC